MQKERSALRLQKYQEQKVEAVKDTDAYKQGMQNYLQNSIIDYNDTLMMIRDKCLAGLERLEGLDDYKGHHLNHTAMQGYLSKIQDLMELHYKIVKDQEKNSKDKVEEDYETLKMQVQILKDVIKEIFQETAPELQPIFVARVKQRMEEAGLV